MVRRVVCIGLMSLMAFILAGASVLGDEDKKTKKPAPTQVAQIKISGSLMDALPPVNPFGPSPMYFKGMLDLIKKAKGDKNIRAIELKVNSPAVGFSKINELSLAIKDFKESGKKVFGYSEGFGTKDLLLLSLCDYLAIPEGGGVQMPGLNMEMMYYKKLLAMLGVEFMVEHIGDYKSAYENFKRDSMSKENREVLECLLDSFYFSIVSNIASNRGIDQVNVIQAIDEALLSPTRALELGLIDEICYRDQFEAKMKSMLKADKVKIQKKYGKSGKDLNLDNPIVLFSQLMSSFTGAKKKESKNPKIALIYASGVIMSGKNSMDPFSGETTIGSDTLAAAIDDAAKDDTVKAIVLRVDSPGGSGLASDVIWRAEMRAKAKKPFIVSMADVAASGGYYIACPAHVILAESTTITGSIGVVSAIPNLSKSMDKLGIKVERISRGKNSGLMSPFTPADEVDLSILSNYMEDFYWKFVDKVADGRNMTRDQVHKVAQGRVWTGTQALKRGLVDAIGGLSDAIQIAKIKAGLTDDMKWEIKETPKAADLFEALSEQFGVRMMTALAKAWGLNATESLLLENPDIKRRLARFCTVFKTCQEDKIMMLLPMDIHVDF